MHTRGNMHTRGQHLNTRFEQRSLLERFQALKTATTNVMVLDPTSKARCEESLSASLFIQPHLNLKSTTTC